MLYYHFWILNVYLSLCLSVFLSFYLTVIQSFCLSAFLFSVILSFCLCFSLFLSVPFCLFVFLSCQYHKSNLIISSVYKKILSMFFHFFKKNIIVLLTFKTLQVNKYKYLFVNCIFCYIYFVYLFKVNNKFSKCKLCRQFVFVQTFFVILSFYLSQILISLSLPFYKVVE